jgi:hypothetical protein
MHGIPAWVWIVGAILILNCIGYIAWIVMFFRHRHQMAADYRSVVQHVDALRGDMFQEFRRGVDETSTHALDAKRLASEAFDIAMGVAKVQDGHAQRLGALEKKRQQGHAR